MQKSCGPDGAYGTPDDGLPSSLEEFAQLCDYIKSKGGSPFIIPGGAGRFGLFIPYGAGNLGGSRRRGDDEKH